MNVIGWMAFNVATRSFRAAFLAGLAVACSTSVTPPSAPPAATNADASVQASVSPTASSQAFATSTPPVAGFPAEAFGLPVISVGDLNRLIASGAMNGRVAAVAGYWESSIVPSCPAPGRWMSPLEGYCEFDLFSDTPYQSATCESGNCNGGFAPPGAETIKALAIDNNENYTRVRSADDGHYFDPRPLVLIGHAADPRWLQCQSDVQRQCEAAFVIDTVAWAEGNPLDLSLQDDPNAPKPRMSIPDVAAVAGGANLVSIALTTADDVNTIDPRIHVAGDNLAWVVRGTSQSSSDGSTSAAVVWAVDDRDGSVIDHLSLDIPVDYHPAYVTTQASVRGFDPGGSGPYPFQGVEQTGSAIHRAMMGDGGAGGPGNSNATRFYPGGPLLLTAGDYVLRAWLSTIDYPGEVIGPVTDDCAMPLSLGPDQRVSVEADFPTYGSCTWGPPTFPARMFERN